MKRVMIWGGSILLLTVLAFVGLIFVLPFVLDPNDYKDKIESLVYEKSGYQLHVPGDIGLKVTPRLDVLFSLGKIEVESGTDFPDVTLLSSEEARVELSLMPLLKEKRLAIKGIKLHGVYCNLIRNTAGKGNWEVSTAKPIAETGAQQSSDKSSSPDVSPKDKNTTQASLEFGSLDLSKIGLRYEDQQTGKRFELKDFSVSTGHVQDGQSFHLQSAFTLISSANSNAALSVQSKLESDVVLTLADKTVALSAFSLQSKINAFGLKEAEMQLSMDAFLDLLKKDVTLKTATISSGLLELQLKAEITDFSKPHFQGNLVIPEFSLRQFLSDNKLNQPKWKEASALTQVGFSCSLAGNKKKIIVSDIELALDGAQARGSFVLLDLERPAYDFMLHLDHFDLDRYATVVPGAVAKPEKPQDVGQTQAKGKETKVAFTQPAFPVDMLRKLRFKLDLGTDTMKVKGANLGKIELKAEGHDGLLQLKPFRAELYDGTISAESTLDVRGKVPQLALKSNLDHVQIGSLLQDMTGKEEISGTAVLSMQIKSSGEMKEQLIRNANGKMNLSFEDGVIQKLHILQVIRQAKSLYDGKLKVSNAEDEPTGFAHITASGVIKDGVFVNKDLNASSDLMKVTGSGKVDLGQEYVDYLLKISLTRGMDRDDKSGKADFSKYVIPYKIQGRFLELKEDADIVGLLKSQAQNVLMNELQKHLKTDDSAKGEDTKKNSTQQLLEHGLKSLFGN